MAVKAGTAFVDFEADFSALNKQVSSQAGKKFGSKLGKDFSAGFQQGTSDLGSSVNSSQARSKMSNAGRSLGHEFATSFRTSTRGIGKDLSASLHQNAVRGIKATATGVAAAFVYTVKSAADFEKQMSNLGSVTDANAKQMKAFEKQALSAGAATKFSAKEAAKAQTELAKGGLSVKQILSGGLDAALGLAAAGEMDLADAAATTVNAMKLFNIRGKDSTKVADAFATAANATTADVSDFAMALAQGGSAAKTAGLSFEGTTAWLEALASSGIKGSDAGTSLKTALIQLSSPSLEASHLMKDLGLKFYDAHGNIKSVVEISGMLTKAMGGMTKEQRIQAATTLAGTDGMRGLLALFDAGPTKMTKFQRGLEKQGSAADVAKKKQDNLLGSIEALGGSVETVAIQFGTAMLPGIRKVTDQLTGFTNDIGKIFERKDLDFGEKMNAAIAKAKIRFGPMAAEIEQSIKDAHLDDKLASVIEWATPKILAVVKKVGIESANVFWDGFKAAPVWAQVGSGVWLANKLGLTGPMFTLLKTMLGNRSGNNLGGLASKAAPIPVFVTNIGGMPGGKGPGGGVPPIIGGGGKGGGGVLGKLRGVGKFAGKAGLALAAADLAINLIDSKGNPISAVQNAAHDLTFGLVPEFKGDTEKAAEGVSSLKLRLDADVQANLPPDFDSKMTALQKQMNDRMLAIRSRTNAANAQMAGAAPDAVGPIVSKLTQANAADVAKLAELGNKLGTTVATAYTTAIDQHHQFFGAGQLTKGFTAELQKLPEQARQGAYDTMINWANTLVQQGRLPRSALNTLVGNFKTTMNLLPSGISAPAKRGIDSLTAQFRRRDMITAAGTMISDLKRKYGEFPSLAKSSGDNMATNFLKSITFLRDGAMHATGKLKTQTKADLKSTRDAALDYAGDMNSGLNAELISMGVKGDKNAKKVRDSIVLAFTQMASGTGTASATSASALYTALSNMDVNADEILSALGITVPKVSLTRPPVARAGPPGTKGWNEMRPTQTGAYVSGGKPSGDSVPILAERGEYVLNRKAVKKVGKGKLDQLNFGEAPRFQSGGFVQLVAKANQIDDQKFPYLWGGGHDAGFSGPYDCSGAISAILHAAGLLQMPMVSGDFMNFGKPGPGGEFTIFANPGHVYGRIGGRYWGTSNANPGGGAGFFDGAARPGFTVRHVDLVDPTLPVENISGMPGKLTDTSQAIIDNSRKSYQGFINDQIATLGSLGGGDDGDSLSVGGGGGPATGNGADLMKSISKSRGWNFADWWALDAKESSHGTNLSNPTSTARLRGQFLDSNWGKYGPGSDPRQNPSMSEQIRSMAAYIADRYDNPTRAWAAWQSHFPPGWYQGGGMISKALGFVIGGAASKSKNAKPKPPKVKNPKIDASKHSKKHKPKDHITNAMIKSLGNAGATKLMDHMNSLEFESNKYADWAQRAGDITNTEALQTALNAQMALLGGTSDMPQAKLDALFPASQQDAFIEAWLRNPLNGAMFNSGTQSDWLSAELSQLLGWRNELIDNPPVFKALRDKAKAAYDKIKADIKRIQDDIALLTKRRDAAIKKEEDNAAALRTAKTDLASAEKDLARHPKSKTRQARVKRLTEHVAKYRSQRDAAHKDRVSYNKQLSKLRGDVKLREDESETLGGDDGTGGRIGTLSALFEPGGGTLGASLNDVQGLGSTLERYVSPSQFQLGTLGGTILGVQTDILRLTANPLRASAEEAATPPPGTGEEDTRTKELLSELLRQANLRVSVSEAQYDVLRGLPFGGTFHSGGVVPGPLGAPRMILAQGGEVVLTNDAANATSNVSVNFANGMEWLKQFVDIRVEDQTRTQGRRGERQLPGRPGILR